MKKLVIIAVSLVFLLAACTGKTTPSGGSSAISAESDSYNAKLSAQTIEPLNEEFVNGNNDFGFAAATKLYSTDVNLALSPVSIELALAMTRVGASGETAKEMAEVLGLDSMTNEQIISACKALMWRANTGGMEAANSIWLGGKYTFDETFLNTCTNEFMADALPLVIPGAMEQINAWVSEKTHERIKGILSKEPIDGTQIILCNALYYLGEWKKPFEANSSGDQTFHTPNDDVWATFMRDERVVPYVSNDTFSMVSLEFKSKSDEGQYAMAFILPSEGIKISDMLSSLDGNVFTGALNAMETQEVWIQLPKFEYTFFSPLNNSLMAMGMEQAFDADSADFSAMTEEPNNLAIDSILHKCYIRIDELGAEAAAVTEIEMTDGAVLNMEEPPKFFADRPFVFAIYSLEDGAIVFMGVVNDPTKE